MNLEKLELILKPLARRYSSDVHEIEDFEQIARLTAWQVLEKKPDASKPYVITAIKNKLLKELIFQRAKKRNSGKKPVSLEGQLRYSLGKPDEPLLVEESMENFIEGLRTKFGGSYIKKIKGNRDRAPYKEKVRGIVRAVIEGIHKIPVSEIPEKVNYKFFVDSGMQRFLWTFYRNSAFDAVMDAYPDEVIPWNFKKKPNRFWKGKKGYDRAVQAVEWFCRKNGIKDLSDCRTIKFDDFAEENLSGMLQKHFNHSPFLALKTKFPGLKPWQTHQTSANYFDNKDNQYDALSSYLIDRGVPCLSELTPEEVYEYGLRTFVTKSDLNKAGLRGLLKQYNGRIYQMFSELFPGKILPWTLHSVKEPWRENPKKTGATAIRWLFDDYLKLPRNEIPEYATCDLFWRVGFSGIMTNRNIGYSSSPYRAVDSAYPDRFSKEEFKRSRWNPTPKLNIKHLKKDQK